MSVTDLVRHRRCPGIGTGGISLAWLEYFVLTLLATLGWSARADTALPGVLYTNWMVPNIPWSIHVVRVDRTNSLYEWHSMHAGGRAVGLATVSSQVARLNPALGTPVAAVNGDFYQRDRTFAGDPRGLQIMENEVLSAPTGGVCFWVDALGEPHIDCVNPQFQITWPDGTVTPFGLNEERHNQAVLYTPAVGSSTHTTGGPELVLEAKPGAPCSPFRMGRSYTVQVKEIRDKGNTPVPPGSLVLSLDRASAKIKNVAPGAVLQISTASVPSLRGVRTAIGGGPVLVHDGKRQRIHQSASESYQMTSMLERHPRSAIGWNDQAYFLVEVDGRQRDLSIGMTLDELAAFLVKLGCTEGMTLDGGGSATLWYDGEVRNSPCDGNERALANSLVLVRKKPKLPPPAETSSK